MRRVLILLVAGALTMGAAAWADEWSQIRREQQLQDIQFKLDELRSMERKRQTDEERWREEQRMRDDDLRRKIKSDEFTRELQRQKLMREGR